MEDIDKQQEEERKFNKLMQEKQLNEESIEKEQHLTAAYQDFKERLSYKYMVTLDSSDFSLLARKMNMIPGNSTPCVNMMSMLIPCLWFGPVFQVPTNKFALVIFRSNQGRQTIIYGPGYHFLSCYSTLQDIYSFDKNYKNNIIESQLGDLRIARVNQGCIMNLECSGQNLILPPGIHMIRDPVIFINNISLDSFFIKIGPERWITVPDGYDGISINRGKIKILHGGKQHHLAHVGDKFAKMIPRILQTDKVSSNIAEYLEKLENSRFDVNVMKNQDPTDPTFNLRARTIEGAFICVDCMIFWNVVDTELAATNAMEILDKQEEYHERNQDKAIQDAFFNIQNLRKTVLRIAKNHLCSLISTFSISSKASKEESSHKHDDYHADVKNSFEILAVLQAQDSNLKEEINKDLAEIGCNMKSICIYSVRPTRDIQEEVDKQTKAKVDARTQIIRMQNTQQTQMIGLETSNKIDLLTAEYNSEVIQKIAQADADAKIFRSNCTAQSITEVAKARKDEADNLTATPIAQELERIRVIGDAGGKVFQGKENHFVFGQNPGDVIFSMLSGLGKK